MLSHPPRIINGLRTYLEESNPDKIHEIGQEQTPQEYVGKLVELFREIRRVLRPDGTVWLNLADSYKEKQLLGIPWKVAFALQEDGWVLRSDIIWKKPNPMPHSVKDRCTVSHEYVFFFTKNKTYFYDHVAIREKSTQHPSDWNPDGTPRRKSQKRGDFQGKNQEKGKEGFRKISATRNKHSVWTVTTVSYKGSHFATFPFSLVSPMILAGCPETCCKECGSPYIRKEKIVGKQITQQMLDSGADKDGNYTGQAQKDYAAGKAQNASDTKRRILESMSKIREYEFVKNCSCETTETKPGVVLDPFLGSGTTAWVAKCLNRDYIGIELNKEYLPLIEERIQQPKPEKKKKKVKKEPNAPKQLSLLEFFE